MFDIILGGVILVVFVLLGIDVSLNIQNKLRARRAERETRAKIGEFISMMEEMEKEMAQGNPQVVRKVVVKPAEFKSAKVKMPKNFGKTEEQRKAVQRERMRKYRAKKRKSTK